MECSFGFCRAIYLKLFLTCQKSKPINDDDDNNNNKKENDNAGCPTHGLEEGGEGYTGISASEACCYCGGGGGCI